MSDSLYVPRQRTRVERLLSWLFTAIAPFAKRVAAAVDAFDRWRRKKSPPG